MDKDFKHKFQPGDVVLFHGYLDKSTITLVNDEHKCYDIAENPSRCIMFEYQDEWSKFARKGEWYICEKEIGDSYEGMLVKYMGDNLIKDIQSNFYGITEQELAENYRIWNPYDIQPGDIVWSPKGAGVETISIVRKFCTVEREKNTLCSEITLRVEDDKLVCGGLGVIWTPYQIDPILPASESQKKHLLDKMSKEGYSYDFKKHKLKKPVRHRPKIDIAEKYADEAVKRADKSLYQSGYSRHTIMGITLFSGADIEEAVDYGRQEERKRILKKLRSWIKGHADSKLVDLLTGFVDDLKQDK
jgi:hypothetical protein